MRICFLLHEGRMQSGGQGVYLSYLSRELARRGHEVHAIVGPPYPELADDVQLHRVETYSYFRLRETDRRFFYGRPPLAAFHPLNFGELLTTRLGMYSAMGAFSLRAYQRFQELHRQAPFDIVHDNQVLGYGTLLIRALGVPVVATIHHPLAIDRQNRMGQARSLWQQLQAALFYPFVMQHLVARRLEKIVTVSQQAAGAICQAFGLSPERVVVVPNGVDAEAFRTDPWERREPRRILFVGRSEDPNKGARYLLEALRLLRDEGCDWELSLVDQEEERLRLVPGLARAYGLASRIHYTAPLSRRKLVRQYNRAQIVVSPSLFEGFGLPAAEAMACGAAVIATTAGAHPELIEDGVSGLLVPPRHVGALARALRRLLDDPATCRRLGEAARGRIVHHFTWERAGEQVEAVYRDVIGAGAEADRWRQPLVASEVGR